MYNEEQKVMRSRCAKNTSSQTTEKLDKNGCRSCRKQLINAVKFLSFPYKSYQWKRNGGLMRIDDYPNIRSSPDPANGTIKIMSAGTLDEGVYQCVASNKYGIAISDKVQLTRAFLGARSDLPTKIVRATPGEPVSLECRAPRSVPKPSYVWALAIAEGDIYPVAYQTNSRVIIDDNGEKSI